nr:hypothetical protein [Mycoplasmopsis bovis]
MFSDYTYNFAEVINRDNLQITYSPSNHDFGNMPSFLSNISESNTGLGNTLWMALLLLSENLKHLNWMIGTDVMVLQMLS